MPDDKPVRDIVMQLIMLAARASDAYHDSNIGGTEYHERKEALIEFYKKGVTPADWSRVLQQLSIAMDNSDMKRREQHETTA